MNARSDNPVMRSRKAIANEFDNSIEILSRHGSLPRKGRISEVSRILLGVSSATDRGQALRDLHAATAFAFDVITAAGLSVDFSPVEHRLRLLCKGHVYPVSLDAHDPGRDLLFELVTAAQLVHSGAAVHLCPGDAYINLENGSSLLVECKRVASPSGLRHRLEEALDQFAGHKRGNAYDIGLVALDLSRWVNPERGVLVAENARAVSDAVHAHIELHLRDASAELARAQRNISNYDCVDALLLRVQSMAADRSGREFVVNIWRVANVVAPDSERFNKLYHLLSGTPGFEPGLFSFANMELKSMLAKSRTDAKVCD